VFAVRVARAARRPVEVAPVAAPTGLAGTRVLALDNDRDALEALRSLLERWGCIVAVAGDRERAISACEAADAAVWLFDYHLDRGDTGVAVAKALADRFGARPTLILSADAGADVRAATHDAGYLLLTKPLKPLALKSTLDRMVAARERPSAAVD
jgi:CheY-like chemotaxis protein